MTRPDPEWIAYLQSQNDQFWLDHAQYLTDVWANYPLDIDYTRANNDDNRIDAMNILAIEANYSE